MPSDNLKDMAALLTAMSPQEIDKKHPDHKRRCRVETKEDTLNSLVLTTKPKKIKKDSCALSPECVTIKYGNYIQSLTA